MTKKLLFTALIALFLGTSALQAQNVNESKNSDKENIEFKNKKFVVPKHAVFVQTPIVIEIYSPSANPSVTPHSN